MTSTHALMALVIVIHAALYGYGFYVAITISGRIMRANPAIDALARRYLEPPIIWLAERLNKLTGKSDNQA